jgi:dihydroorotate dehydrogenase (NAD+) catalytic subunit
VFVSVAGNSPEAYWEVVEILDPGPGFLGFELNLSCPNDRSLDALPFALDPDMSNRVIAGVKERTRRPVLAKLAPNTPDWKPIVQAVESAGADGITLVNTLPGYLVEWPGGGPVVGAGTGGVSGPALLPIGLQAVRSVARHTRLPLVGVGGVSSGRDAAAYLAVGAALIQIGTASFWDPRTAPRVVEELRRLRVREGSAHG